MDNSFEASYKALNVRQREAVDYLDGPLLVIAGPGTGKTQLLSLRVANILKQTDTDPGSILCLTFTNAAATNMKERLLKYIGPTASSIDVRTFHSFAAEIMQLYPDYFWNGAHLSIVPDAVQRLIVEDLLAELPLDNPLSLKFGGHYTMIKDVIEGLRLAKEAGLTPAKLKALLEVNERYIDEIEPLLADLTDARLSLKGLDKLVSQVTELPDQAIDETVTPLLSLSTVIKDSLSQAVEADKISGKTKQTGLWKRRFIQTVAGERGMFQERQRGQWWLNLAEIYELYRNRLHEQGYYDYADMIVEVISTLEQNQELQALVQERYLYLLIDEFQDTNKAQLRLAHLVTANPIVGDRPNLMAVGDDDQSIFAFNGAELNNMLSFTRTYPATKLVVLVDNYRSNQAILDTAAQIINQVEDRLSTSHNLSKDLKAVQPIPDGQIKSYRYPTREQQLQLISERIQGSLAEDNTQSIAVLARNHKSLRDIAAYLIKCQVPIKYEQQNNVLELDLIKQLILLSNIIGAIISGDNKTANYYLPRLLAYPAWQIGSLTLWKLAVQTAQTHSAWLDSLIEHPDPALEDLAGWLLKLAQIAQTEPLPVVFDYLIGMRSADSYTSPLRNYYLDGQTTSLDYLTNLSGLKVISDLVHEFVAAAQTMPSLSDFINFIKQSDRITDSSWYVSHEHAVELLSIHKAKGLEFDTVYVIDAIDSEWQPRHLGRKPPANLPLQPNGELLDDYVRLAYVAATRARRNLIVSSYKADSSDQPMLTSPIFQSIPSDDIADQDNQTNITALETSLSWPELDLTDEKLLLGPRLEQYQLSVTGLTQFLDVTEGGPGQFLERQLLRLPILSTDYMAYGTAIHASLQTAQSLINRNAFSLEQVIESFKNSLIGQYLPIKDLKKYLDHGEQTLTRLFETYRLALTPGDQAEVVIDNLIIGPARVNGKLDHVHKDNDKLIITDYKTGSALTSFTTRDQTKAVKAWRQRTQLLFYSLLAQSSPHFKGVHTIEPQIIYVQTDDLKHLKLNLTPDPAELDRLTKLIASVWRHVINLDLPDTSAYPKTIEGIHAFENDLLK